MQLTEEQLTIVNSAGNLLINAVAGSGKTSTLIAYAKARPPHTRILYIAFNKTVKEEAIRKFSDAGLKNVSVETAHSLAFRNIVRKNNYQVRNSYKNFEIVKLLGLQGQGERHVEYIAASHILKFTSLFCNSSQKKVQDLDYRTVVSDPKALSFVNSCYNYLEKQTRRFLAKMNKGEIEVTHDFYLKKFQLSEPILFYDIILFDEGQDASEAMLDIFLRQNSTRVIVGDTHQQIYGWRYAVNSLQKVNFPLYRLSNSFRFNKDIAQLAEKIIGRKELLGEEPSIKITGSGTHKVVKTKAVIARTNLSLLLKAIDYTKGKQQIKKLHFEGNFNSYTYAEDGASLYDVLNLHTGKKGMIKDILIREMKDLDDLEEYIKKTEDVQLGLMVEIVRKYGSKIPEIIRDLKNRQVDKKEDADLIFSTVHRSKGMEYDQVELADDFISIEDLLKFKEEKKSNDLQKSKKLEEINLLYVAVTRTKNLLQIPSDQMQEDFPPSDHIKYIGDDTTFESADKTTSKPAPVAKKTYDVDEVRKTFKQAYGSWTTTLDDELTILFCEGRDPKEIAERFGRTPGAIRSRIKKLELEEMYG